MTININELRSMVNGAQFESFANSVINALLDRLETAEKERDALRAKIEAMEQQEPVAEIGEQYTLLFAGSGSMTELVKRHGIKIGTKLYPAPGAHPPPCGGGCADLPGAA